MNRLIIIGNGFDLAHGMKTRYSDFLFDLFKRGIDAAKVEGEYETELYYLRRNSYYPNLYLQINSIHQIKGFDCSDNSFLYDYSKTENRQMMLDNMVERNTEFSFIIKYPFLLKILHSIRQNWVDIEQLYFDELKIILTGQTNQDDELIRLNSCLKFLIKELNFYIVNLPKPRPLNSIRQTIFEIERPNSNSSPYVKQIILNFNYTNLIETYLSHNNWNDKFEHVQIHGRANDSERPIIFGYGDETDEAYKKMEDSLNDEFLRFAKQVEYSRNSAYRDLVKLLNQHNFDVHVVGHSLGLSDRIMLKTIFEHKRCNSIQLFYHGSKDKNNFFEFQRSLSRHFSASEKGQLRIKRIPLSESIRLPQFDDPN